MSTWYCRCHGTTTVVLLLLVWNTQHNTTNSYGVKVPGNEDGRACMVAVVTKDGELPDFVQLCVRACVRYSNVLCGSTVRRILRFTCAGGVRVERGACTAFEDKNNKT
jgi:hypothetical protein